MVIFVGFYAAAVMIKVRKLFYYKLKPLFHRNIVNIEICVSYIEMKVLMQNKVIIIIINYNFFKDFGYRMAGEPSDNNNRICCLFDGQSGFSDSHNLPGYLGLDR